MLISLPFAFLAVSETKHDDIVNAFKSFTSRDDISVILITQTVSATDSSSRAEAARRILVADAVSAADRSSLSRPVVCRSPPTSATS
jgi:hypothetical protein